jgi:hypothetical protein
MPMMMLLEQPVRNHDMRLEYPNIRPSNTMDGHASFQRNHDDDHHSTGKRGICLINQQQSPVVGSYQPKLTNWLFQPQNDQQHDEEQHEPNSKRRRSQSNSNNKSVRICNELEVREYRYPAEEVPKAWYSDRDYKRFVQECRDVILRKLDECSMFAVQKQEKPASSPQQQQQQPCCVDEASSCCIRGLEDQLVPRINRLKVTRRRGLIKMVVRQHVIDKMIGTSDACGIRSISASFSSDSKQRALDLAAYDAAFVRNSLLLAVR